MTQLRQENLYQTEFQNGTKQYKENLMESKEVAQVIAGVLSEKKARDIVMIDIAEKSSFADYFVNATGGSERQLGALADEIEDKFAEIGITPKSKDGRPDTGWILVDGGDVIVNLFTEATRDKYTLEKIWSDCESVLVG
jgi:ribosome-associated protein